MNIIVQLDDGRKITVATSSEHVRQVVDRIVEFGVREQEGEVSRCYPPHRIALIEVDHGKR